MFVNIFIATVLLLCSCNPKKTENISSNEFSKKGSSSLDVEQPMNIPKTKVPIYVQNCLSQTLINTNYKARKFFMLHYNKEKIVYAIEVVDETFGDYGVYLLGCEETKKICTSHPTFIFEGKVEEVEEGYDTEFRLIDYPVIDFIDIDNDGKKEILFKLRVHNGTAYHASIYNYFGFEDNLDIKSKLMFEDKTIHPVNCNSPQKLGRKLR